jgi:WYL_2, Sm-like SH3 beta-barrel fold
MADLEQSQHCWQVCCCPEESASWPTHGTRAMTQITLTGDRSERRAQLTEMLIEGIVEVTFTKLSGESRTMPCTLKPSIIPPARAQDAASQKKVRGLNEAVMVAWCTDRSEWRSFRIDNVISVNL